MCCISHYGETFKKGINLKEEKITGVLRGEAIMYLHRGKDGGMAVVPDL